MKYNKEIRGIVKGERAAISGYLAQYDEFSRKVYECINQNDLECIRVADTDENVGKLDDICYVTNTEVHAYQVKWSISDRTFKYSDFIELIKHIAEGWKKLKSIYPHKTVIPHLLTNRKCSKNDKIIINTDYNIIYSFTDYITNIIEPLCNSTRVNLDCSYILNKLYEQTGLSEKESEEFWPLFKFKYEYNPEPIEISQKLHSQRTSDIIDINRLIQEIVASKEKEIVVKYSEIIQRLGWDKRINTLYDHNLNVILSTYEPNKAAINNLNSILKTITKGYIFLEGTPGSGKSTLITQWVKQIPNKSIRYYAFDFTRPSSQLINDTDRGSRNSFLYDIIKMLENIGIKSKDNTLIYNDYQFLKKRFIEILDIIHEDFIETKLSTIIVVDGLDHIDREYKKCINMLMEVLPSCTEIPEGVIFILGSQYFKNIGLNDSIISEYNTNTTTTIKLPSLLDEEVRNLATKILGTEIANDNILEICINKSQGHPLYLRYILNQIINSKDTSILKNIPSYNGDIETYYKNIIPCLSKKANMQEFLGLLSRVIGDIHYDFIKEWNIDRQVLLDFKNTLIHLFVYQTSTNTLSFFHNSFRQFLLNETAKDCFNNTYSEEENHRFYKQLAQYAANSSYINKWNLPMYLLLAQDFDNFTIETNPDVIYNQIQEFRPIWHVKRDIEGMIQVATEKKDIYHIVRILLLKSQLNQMEMQDFSALTVVEQLINIGHSNIAKLHIRENRELKCSKIYALKLSRVFLEKKDIAEANILFELSYPKVPHYTHNDYHIYGNKIDEFLALLEEWAYTAPNFMNLDDINKEIQIITNQFLDYIINTNEYEKYNIEYIKYTLQRKIISSLIIQHKWYLLDNYITTFSKHNSYSKELIYYRFREQLLEQIKISLQTDEINKTFNCLQIAYKSLENKGILSLEVASLAKRSNLNNEIIDSYLSNIKWENLGSFYLNYSQEDFSFFNKHIQYITLRAYLGYNDSIIKLVPEDNSRIDNELIIDYARKIFTLAKIVGNAMRGYKDENTLLSLIKPYISFFDKTHEAKYNKYSYIISKQRAAFYCYLIDVASCYESTTFNKVIDIICKYLKYSDSKSNTDTKRKFICKLYTKGIDKDYLKNMLDDIENNIYENQDLYGRQTETLEQAKVWLMFEELERANKLLKVLQKELFGVGYRKDYQPTIFARWINDINKIDPSNAEERINWLISRLDYINDSCEYSIVSDAATKLLKGVLELNLESGIRCGLLMLDSEYISFKSFSSILISSLLKITSNEQDYRTILRLYLHIHLSIDDSYEPNITLLEDIYNKGKELLKNEFNKYLSEIQLYLSIECQEDHQKIMLDTLKKLITPNNNDNDENKEVEHYYKEEELLYNEALIQFTRGNNTLAWKNAKEALIKSNKSGWAQYSNNEIRFKSCKLLQLLNKKEGKQIAFNQFTEDLKHGLGYLEMDNINNIVHLLCDEVDMHRIFEEQFAYMNRILREDSVNPNQHIHLSSNKISICEAITSWLSFISETHIVFLSEKAKVLLSKLIIDYDTNIIKNIEKLGCSIRTILEIGMYVKEMNINSLKHFKDIATINATSTNYLFRIYSKIILNSLGAEIPNIKQISLPSIYTLYLPKQNTLEYYFRDKYEGYINWDDPCSVMKINSKIISYLSQYSNVEEINIATRGYQIMKNHGNTTDWDDNADRKIYNHYMNISLYYPPRRLRALPAIDAIMEVASELLDSGNIIKKYNDKIFLMNDFGTINIMPKVKPSFIQRIAEYNSRTIPKNWEILSKNSICFSDKIHNIDNMYVIAQSYKCQHHSHNLPFEEYNMMISINRESSTNFYKFDIMLSEYLEFNNKDSDIIIFRELYYNYRDSHCNWIAINPIIAKKLGWIPANDGYFAWNDKDGNRMVESFYWKSGNIEFSRINNHESGDGWYILASSKAIKTIKTKYQLYNHQIVRRGLKTKSPEAFSAEFKTYNVEL